MSDAADLRQKASTCIRLAEAASSARANELFKRLAEEYRAKAAALETPIASPSIAPPAFGETPVASILSDAPHAAAAAVEINHAAAVVAAVDHIETDSISPCLAPMPDVSPLQAPQANSAQWLAELQALRARL